jgi:glycosyltransferase involved in cell wall biosynthesis
MKVLHVNTHINVGGIGQYIVSLTSALRSKGVDCSVATSGGDLETELKRYGIKHIYLDLKTKSELSPKVLRAVFSLTDIVKKEGIDLIHAHSRVSQVAAFFASRRAGIPYVSTCHGYFKTRLSRRLFDTWGKKVVAISDAVKSHLQKDFGLDERRIELVYNGVDVTKFLKTYRPDEIAKAKLSLGLKEGPVVGTMGRLSDVKGQRFLVEAMKYVISKKKDAQCLIIGGGREEKALKSLARDLGIEGSIIFAGSNYADAPLYLSCMDVFVLPSVKEGLGLALLEAMLTGKPCVGSDIGGISDIIKNGVNGVLIPVGDVKAIGDAIVKLLDDRILRENIGLKGRGSVREKFSLDLMADKIAALYGEVINEK